MSTREHASEAGEDDLEVASGLGCLPVSSTRLFGLAAAMVPADKPMRRILDSPVMIEDLSAMGPGYVEGLATAADHAMVVSPADLAVWGQREQGVIAAIQSLRDVRANQLVMLDPGETLRSWYDSRAEPPRAITVIGSAIPWSQLTELQLAGVCAARVPLGTAQEAAIWADRTADRWRREPSLRRRAWVVAPADDLFTRRLAEHALPDLRRMLEDLGFAVPLVPPADNEPVGMIVLMTHGNEVSGAPVIPAAVGERVLRACANGGLVIHLGCHGAGSTPGKRYGDLPCLVGGAPVSAASIDACSRFAQDCLSAGACAVIGHLDVTWSRTLARRGLLAGVIERLATGTATVACAARLLADESNRRARLAIDLVAAGDLLAAGEAWLRHLDLSGFVCTGDACEFPRWDID